VLDTARLTGRFKHHYKMKMAGFVLIFEKILLEVQILIFEIKSFKNY
jgi:hypothetical protein